MSSINDVTRPRDVVATVRGLVQEAVAEISAVARLSRRALEICSSDEPLLIEDLAESLQVIAYRAAELDETVGRECELVGVVLPEDSDRIARRRACIQRGEGR